LKLRQLTEVVEKWNRAKHSSAHSYSEIQIESIEEVGAVSLEEQDSTEDDYIVLLKRPDGSSLSIIVPRESIDSWPNIAIKDRADKCEPFGLNFVSEGHYT